jgi:hypothetical protein
MRYARSRWAVVVAGLVLAVPFVGGDAAAGGSSSHGVILANNLNSAWSIEHSRIGADFDLLGTPVFARGVARRSMGTIDDETVLLMPFDDFFGKDPTQGTVSVWLKKRMVASIPYETPLNGVFGMQPYEFQDAWCIDNPLKNPDPRSDSCTNYAINGQWGDGVSGPAGLYMEIVDRDGNYHQIVDSAFNTAAVPVGKWVHVKFVWDLDGICGGHDVMRITRNGKIVARSTEHIAGILDLPTPVAFGGSHATSRFDGPSLLYDELMVFERAMR